MASVFSFPNPVNEKAARTVAVGVVLMGVVYIVTGWMPLLIVMTYGFLARVASGPRFSPLGQIATRVVAPRLGAEHLTPGPPKRFAQSIGLLFSATALGLDLGGLHLPSRLVIAGLVVAASLEGFAGYCLGCKMFTIGMKVGIVPEHVCVECADITNRYPQLNAK